MRLVVFGAALLLMRAPTLEAQSSPAPTAQKDAGVATILGIVIPGGGQYYAEAPKKGLVYTALTVSSVLVGRQLSSEDEYTFTLSGGRTLVRNGDRSPALVGAVLGGAFWLLGALDAPSDARKANAKRARVSAIATPGRLGLSVEW